MTLFDLGSALEGIAIPARPRPNPSPRALTEHRLARRRVIAMLGTYGRGPAGQTCGACQWLIGQQNREGRRTFYKCGVYGRSSSSATDWRKYWPACGRFVP